MKQTSEGGMMNISTTRIGAAGCTPRVRGADINRGPLPGSTRWRNSFRCASPVVAVDPFDARGCRKYSSQFQMQKAVIGRIISSNVHLIVPERHSS